LAATALTGLGCATGAAHTEGAVVSPLSRPKRVEEMTLHVPARLAGDFAIWLPTYVKKLIELPGFLGVKVLSPLVSAEETPAVIFVLGGPGAGKGTQCAKIVEAHGYVHLSAGDLLRAERASGSSQGQMIDEYIREGKIVPVEVRRDASASHAYRRGLGAAPMASHACTPGVPTAGDGGAHPRRDSRRRRQAVPRRRLPAQHKQPLRMVRYFCRLALHTAQLLRLPHARVLHPPATMQPSLPPRPPNRTSPRRRQKQAGGELRVAGVLVFDCPEEVMESRLLERGKTSGRSDDNTDSIRKRFHTFNNETVPVIKFYEHQVDETRNSAAALS